MGRKVLEEIVAKVNQEDLLGLVALLMVGALALCVIIGIIGTEIARILEK